ncbi:MAG: pro-sigmaK processing inhibitor BofA family protein [Clostridium sp.]|uniref:pro-sigmaK processing inhibitor BofA family protein n=1 Tax=Clostridium sp. TaxID=1506 RepID=UPI002A8A4B52|nr:pro-sigmaK processing inhibitor BofA family protein [Clostridium sp.]MDY5096914.1 pro-sigmaK processing inhibitor BofA family protein [Clostridium sp.]
MEAFIGFLIGLLVLFLVVKIFAWPIKILLKLIVNGILGGILLWLVNLVGGGFGLYIGINIVTALIAGILGIPGVLFLIIFTMFM